MGDDYLTRAILEALDLEPGSAGDIAHRMRRRGFVDCATSTVDGVLRRLESAQRIRRTGANPSLWQPRDPPGHGGSSLLPAEESATDLLKRLLASSQREALERARAKASAEEAFARRRAEIRSALLEQLPALAVTPAGNPRAVSIQIDASGPRGELTARLEVLDDAELPFWLCMPARTHEEWVHLRNGAESSTSWSLPLIPAPQRNVYPALLVWRCCTIEDVVVAAERAALALTLDKFEKITVAVAPTSKAGPKGLDGDAAVAQRLIRRRGLIPAGRKYPVRGFCDHCGQPLSDPYSLLIGVGPVCRTYYSPSVLRAVASSSHAVSGSEFAARKPADALALLAALWRTG